MEKKLDAGHLKDFPHPNDCVYVDVETNGILFVDTTKFHAICMTVGDNPLRYSSLKGDQTVADGIAMLKRLVVTEGLTPVFHNGAGYDIQMIHKFFPETREWLRIEDCVDTFLLSCVLEPDRSSGHSLDAWGEDCGIAKVVNTEWEDVTEHIVQRCIIDTEITKEVYERLFPTILKHNDDDKHLFKALTLESMVSGINQKQMNKGVHYNLGLALSHWNDLSLETKILEESITKDAPWKTLIPNVPLKDQETERGLASYDIPSHIITTKAFKKNGGYTAYTRSYFPDGLHHTVKGDYSKIEMRPFNLDNSGDVKDFLLEQGWIPAEWNYKFENGRKEKTSPKLTEESFDSLPPGLGAEIAKYRTLTHRKRSILNETKKGETKGAISNIRKDGRISAEALTCGTPTARYRHMKTVCNIPRPSSVFGKEIRECFDVPKDHHLIGIDLAGIEARMLAHYLEPYAGSAPIIKAILAKKGSGEDDFHTRNAKMWKVNRDKAKSGLYALTNQRI